MIHFPKISKPSLSRRRFLGGSAAIASLPLLGGLGGSIKPAGAQTALAAANLTEADLADVARIEGYLNQLTTLRARFQQYSSTSGLAYGSIYLRRPGRLRVEYDPPVEAMIIADGILVSYYDKELDQLNQVPIDLSPLWFLLREDISFSDGVTISLLERSPGVLRLGAFDSEEPEAGSVTLIFADNPLELRQWTIIDGQGNEVRVGLQDLSLGGALANELFATPEKRRSGGGAN